MFNDQATDFLAALEAILAEPEPQLDTADDAADHVALGLAEDAIDNLAKVDTAIVASIWLFQKARILAGHLEEDSEKKVNMIDYSIRSLESLHEKVRDHVRELLDGMSNDPVFTEGLPEEDAEASEAA